MGNARRKPTSHREDDCLCLLNWASKHRDDRQTYRSLEASTGIPRSVICTLIAEAEEDPYGSSLTRAAYKWRFEWRIKTKDGKILDAEYRGY